MTRIFRVVNIHDVQYDVDTDFCEGKILILFSHGMYHSSVEMVTEMSSLDDSMCNHGLKCQVKR